MERAAAFILILITGAVVGIDTAKGKYIIPVIGIGLIWILWRFLEDGKE